MSKMVIEVLTLVDELVCPFCGHDVSDEETICPCCDEPMKGESAATYFDMSNPYAKEQ